MKSMGQMFHFMRPLLETAFAEMGYRPRQMDGIILQAIDNILATPIIVEPIKLTRDSVAYKFADPELEALLPSPKATAAHRPGEYPASATASTGSKRCSA